MRLRLLLFDLSAELIAAEWRADQRDGGWMSSNGRWRRQRVGCWVFVLWQLACNGMDDLTGAE